MQGTHRVVNQSPPLDNYSLWGVDPLVKELSLPEDSRARMAQFGAELGTEDVQRAGALANECPPVLHTHDRFGHRSDSVEFHPAYHQMMSAGMAFGVHCLPWTTPKPTQEAHLERLAGHYMLFQTESGVCCPLTMTFAGVASLRKFGSRELNEEWLPKFIGRDYDHRFCPVTKKSAATMGMAMTEKQGGSDVRSNTTIATHQGGDEYLLRGHKWFCSAPMSDAFLTLAQTDNGLTCFFVPRWRPDETINSIRLVRLKDKLGNRSNASSEIEYEDTWAVRVGEEGRGVATIIEMVNHTRFDCVIGSTALMRAGLTQALHHACHRKVFGHLLKEQPLMINVLADLCLEMEAAWHMIVRLARAYGASDEDPKERAFARLATAVAKFWVCKRAPMVVVECLECLGGNGYVEEFPLARHFREAPVLSVWEGSSNVIALDILRSLQRDPDTIRLFLNELATSEYTTRQTLEAMVVAEADPYTARRLATLLARHWQVQLMENSSTPGSAEAFYRSRVENDSSLLGLGTDLKRSRQIVERFLAPFEN